VSAATDVELGPTGWWTLLAECAAYWCDRRWLIVADAHFGKAATFRAFGVPVPEGTTGGTLARLTRLVERLRPEAIVFLGDLFHAREAHAAPTLDAIDAWRAQHAALDLVLVEGNHDRAAGAPPAGLGIHVECEPWRVGSVAFCHHPQFVRDAFALAGHLHPAVRICGRADDTVRMPCFWLRSDLIVLPAFGEFTGGALVEREDGDRVFGSADGRLYEIPRRAARSYC
jgi:DNA ligase-associated metallophosphoesterase